jgi:two-component system NtrC family sensor kinase
MSADNLPALDCHILKMAVELSPSSILITDRLARIEYVNPRLCELTGYSRDELLGRNPRLLQSGRTSPEEYRRLWDTLHAGRTWSGIFSNRRKNGELYWEAARITPVTGPAGEITHFLGIKEDITALRQLEDDLQQARKAGYVGRLASGIAHDFNNLLGTILGFGTPVQRALHGTRFGEDLGRVLSAAERATELARNLFVLGARLPAQPQSVDLGAALHSMLPLLHHLLGHQVRLELDLGPQAPAVFFDPVQLQQVLLGLLATRQESLSHSRLVRIATTAEQVDAARAALHPRVQPGLFARVSVRAEGAPLAAADPEPSTLSILRNHGGFLEEDSTGSATLLLPLAPATAPPEPAPAAELPVLPVLPAKASVLVVDDDADVRQLLRRTLEGDGYAVDELSDGDGVEQLLESRHFHLVITDLVMPLREGLEVVRAVRRLFPTVRIIATSGAFGGYFLEVASRLGADSVLPKPLRPEAVLACVAAVLGQPIGIPPCR